MTNFSYWILGRFFPSLFHFGHQKKTILNMGSHMTKIAAILLATSAITAATQSLADTYDASVDQNEPFFWTDIDENRTTGTNTGAKAPAKPADGYGTMPSAGIVEPSMKGSAGDPRTTAPKNPMQEAYPEKDAPRHHVPEAGTGRYFDDECRTNENAPYGMEFTRKQDIMGVPRGLNTDPEMRRRGEMAGDDGVLEAIQDDPCAVIYRRGGPNAASLNEYTHPDDIRRVNTLEDRQIPVHEVGRYAPEGSSLWHRDPNNPFVDASRKWRVERGVMLSQMLTAWGEEAGFNVVWRSAHDYVVQTDVVINGTFPEAAGQVIESFANANPPIAGDFYLSNRVLVVDTSAEFDGR
jgi:hypothetical protein